MRTRLLGNLGPQVSTIALGSWLTFGESIDLRATRELVARARDLGVSLFDTADVYADGQAEVALGRALADTPRDRVVIASKCFFPTSPAPSDRGLSRQHVTESVEASLRRLDSDYIDLYQCHRFDPETPLEETIRTYDDLIRDGKLRYWGTSLWTGDQIAAACEIADATGSPRPVSNQPVYSILRRELERDVLPRCRQLGIGQIVFSPLGQGTLSGKYSGGARPVGSRGSHATLGRFMQRYLVPDTLRRIDQLSPLAKELGITMAELALAWCLRDPGVTSVIVGATGAKQLEENCRAAEIDLPASIVRRIDDLFEPGTESLPADDSKP